MKKLIPFCLFACIMLLMNACVVLSNKKYNHLVAQRDSLSVG